MINNYRAVAYTTALFLSRGLYFFVNCAMMMVVMFDQTNLWRTSHAGYHLRVHCLRRDCLRRDL